MLSLVQSFFLEEDKEEVVGRENTGNLTARLVPQSTQTPSLPRLELLGVETSDEPHSVYFKIRVVPPGDHETQHIVMKCYRHFVDFHSELAAALPSAWLPQLPLLSSEIDPMDPSFQIRLGDYLECIAFNKELIGSAVARKFFHLPAKHPSLERHAMQPGVTSSQSEALRGALSDATSLVRLSKEASCPDSSSGFFFDTRRGSVETKSASTAGKGLLTSTPNTRAHSREDSLLTARSSSPFSPSAYRSVHNFDTKEVQSGGLEVQSARSSSVLSPGAQPSIVSAPLTAEQLFEIMSPAKPRAGCHKAARLPVAEALGATNEVALSASADKSGGMTATAWEQPHAHCLKLMRDAVPYAQVVVPAHQDAKYDLAGLTNSLRRSDCTSKVAPLSCAADADGTPSKKVSRCLIDDQPVRQMRVLQKNAWHEMACSIEAAPRHAYSNSGMLPHFTAEAGRTLSSMALGGCRNGSWPAHTLEAGRNSPASAVALTNTAQAVSAFYCAGKVVPPVYLAKSVPSLSLPALAPSTKFER